MIYAELQIYIKLQKYKIKNLYDNKLPNGPVRGGQVGALKAGYDIFTEGTGGVMIHDVTRCGELIYETD